MAIYIYNEIAYERLVDGDHGLVDGDHGRGHLHPTQNQNRRSKYRFGCSGDLESAHGASSHGTKVRSEQVPTIGPRNPPPYDKPKARTWERWDSRLRTTKKKKTLYQTSLPLLLCHTLKHERALNQTLNSR